MSTSIDRDLLKEQAAKLTIHLEESHIERFVLYAQMLIEWNEKINLTAITQPEEIVVKHFTDSLTIHPYLKEDAFLIDVGTGAGFPGVPIAILRPDIRLTLLDSLNKRLIFLKELCAALHIPVTLIHARAEEAGRRQELREKFDIATARAVASLPVLSEYCLPLVKVGGQFIAMKGPDGEAEAEEAANAVKRLGGQIRKIEKIGLTCGNEALERRIILIDKKAATEAKYPRIAVKIAKQPL